MVKEEMDGGLELACCVECGGINNSVTKQNPHTHPLLSVAAVKLALTQGAAVVAVAGFAGIVVVLIRCFLGQLLVK